MLIRFIYIILLFITLSFGVGCINNTKTMEEMKPYDGPLMEIDNMKTVFTENAEVRVILTAKKQLALQNGNREFTEGVTVDFYDHGTISSTLTSNFGRYYKEENKYMVSGNVVIVNVKEDKRLNTEELYWMPANEKILVEKDKQVIITSKDGVLKGKGLEANQDFSKYKILSPQSDNLLIK